jgi:hypothetical protein
MDEELFVVSNKIQWRFEHWCFASRVTAPRLERFSNAYALTGRAEGGFFPQKKLPSSRLLDKAKKTPMKL